MQATPRTNDTVAYRLIVTVPPRRFRAYARDTSANLSTIGNSRSAKLFLRAQPRGAGRYEFGLLSAFRLLYDHLHPPVEPATFLGIVRGHRRARTESPGRNALAPQAGLAQGIGHSPGPLVRQALVLLVERTLFPACVTLDGDRALRRSA